MKSCEQVQYSVLHSVTTYHQPRYRATNCRERTVALYRDWTVWSYQIYEAEIVQDRSLHECISKLTATTNIRPQRPHESYFAHMLGFTNEVYHRKPSTSQLRLPSFNHNQTRFSYQTSPTQEKRPTAKLLRGDKYTVLYLLDITSI
jgi:hypothetical protein